MLFFIFSAAGDIATELVKHNVDRSSCVAVNVGAGRHEGLYPIFCGRLANPSPGRPLRIIMTIQYCDMWNCFSPAFRRSDTRSVGGPDPGHREVAQHRDET